MRSTSEIGNLYAIKRLRDVAHFVRGITFTPDDVMENDAQDALLCMRTKNVQNDLDLTDVWGIPARFVKRSEQFLQTGDILISSANSWNLVGKCCWIPNLDRRATFGGFVSVLRGDPAHVDLRYLYRWFSSGLIQTQIRSFGRQTTNISNLDIDRCGDLRLAVPPLPDQKRIAKILDQADDLRRKRESTVRALGALGDAIFYEMFGDPASNPRRWPVKRIGDIAEVVTGNTPSRANAENYGNGIEWIKSDNINTPSYYLTPAEERLSKQGESLARTAPPGSILVTCIAGSPDCIGNAAMADRVVSFNQQINAIIPTNSDPHYLYAVIRVGKRLVGEASTGGMKGLVSKSRFEDIRLPIPPFEIQRAFGERILAVERAKIAHQASLDRLNALFASLQHRAFRGELTSNAAERELAEAS